MTTSDVAPITATFLMTDVEGSTRRWDQDRIAASRAMALQEKLLGEAIAAHNGRVVKSRGEGDSVFAVFGEPVAAVAAALEAQRRILTRQWPGGPLHVRMAILTGEVEARDGDYYGPTVNRCARVREIAHGDQILVAGTAASLARHALPEGASLADLGMHGLRGLSRPERIFQLLHPSLPEAFPPLASVDALRHNIPAALTTLIGRARELADVASLLDTARLVTLTGVGGTGKTRLAMHAGSALVDRFDDGSWFVELTTHGDEASVASVVAGVLGVREEPGVDVRAALVERLRDRSALLILDNCEHLVAACASLVSQLLASCPRLRVLATSREMLGVAGESLYVVPPLSVPDPRGGMSPRRAAGADAVRLIIERIRDRRHDFDPDDETLLALASICAHLDGIPLAIEVAAARVAVLGPKEVASRIGDRFTLLRGGARDTPHGTLAATLDWSYELLPREERALYARLSVFAGRFTLDAAEAVCTDDELPRGDILDLVTRLADKSLVLPHDDAFRMLAIVRAHAVTKLASDVAARMRDRHLTWFLALAERAAPALIGREQGAWLDRLESDHGNLVAAVEESLEHAAGDDRAIRLVGALWPYWVWHGHQSEGRAWAERALEARPTEPSDALARALRAAGVLAAEHGDYDTAVGHFDDGLGIARALGNRSTEAWLLNGLGVVARRRDRLDDARALFERSIAAHRSEGDRLGELVVMGNLGVTLGAGGEHEEARALLDRSIEVGAEIGHRLAVAGAIAGRADIERAMGETEHAEGSYVASLRMQLDLGALEYVAPCLDGLAAIAAEGDPVRAAVLLGAAHALREAMGVPLPSAARAGHDSIIEALEHSLGSEAAAAMERGRSLRIEEAIRFAIEQSPDRAPR